MDPDYIQDNCPCVSLLYSLNAIQFQEYDTMTGFQCLEINVFSGKIGALHKLPLEHARGDFW